MKVSVVIATYAPERFDDFVEAVRSIQEQTYDRVELVLVIDGNDEVCDMATQTFSEDTDLTIHCNETNEGLSYSRTKGVEEATGDVIAFLDDDAVADPDWIAELVRGYEETDAIAVGGPTVPEWMTERPPYLPEEYFWLIGANYEQRLEPWTEVRNTNGSNMSFRSEVFAEIGGFDQQFGLTSDSQIQSEETEFAIRMQETFGKGVLYHPDAVVAHKIYAYRTDPWWLCNRAFWQGYSKRKLSDQTNENIDSAESDFLKLLVTDAVPSRIRGLQDDFAMSGIQQLVMVLLLTVCVGTGYLYGVVDETILSG